MLGGTGFSSPGIRRGHLRTEEKELLVSIDQAPSRVPSSCPVIQYDLNANKPVGGYNEELDQLREESPVYWNQVAQGYWMVTRFEDQRKFYQEGLVFTSESIISADPEPQYLWIPTMIDGPDHTKYRQILNVFFSPMRVATLESQNREIARTLIAELKDRGSCNLVLEFCGEFATRAFFALAGFPQEEAPRMAHLVDVIFSQMADASDHSAQAAAAMEIREFFADLIAERRVNPRDPKSDLTTHLLNSTFYDAPLDDETLLNILGVIILAGLDTTKNQLTYSFYHLATTESDRKRILDEPELIPSFIEESLRYYAIVQPARKLSEDRDLLGCPMKKGDMVHMDLAQSCRDPRVFDRADEFVIDRQNNKHLAFGPGAHRCLGSHLARQELVIAIEEWHKVIPNYAIDTEEPILEHGGMRGIISLPIRWVV